jgi:hypothetical protein
VEPQTQAKSATPATTRSNTSSPTATSTPTPARDQGPTNTPPLTGGLPHAAVGAPPATQPSRAIGDVVAWEAEQRPSAGGVVQADRIQRIAAPGPAAGRPAGDVLRFELRPGDIQDSGGYRSNRVEVYGRTATPMSTPASQWPDPVGSVRWYTFALYVPEDFVTATDTSWLTFTQWKGLEGGSPPVALEIKRDRLRLGGARANAGVVPGDGDLGPLTKGAWTTLTVGLSLSTDAHSGWVEVWRDGSIALPRTAMATMDVVNGVPDPVYLKQGIYRDSSWSCTQVLVMGPVRVSSTRPGSSG